MALFQITNNDAVVVSAFKDATKEVKIGDNLGECQDEGDDTTDGRDTNQEETGAEDTDKESFSDKGVNRESLLDPANEDKDLSSNSNDSNDCQNADPGEKGDENTDKEENGKSWLKPTNDTLRIRGQYLEAGTTSSHGSKPEEQVVRFEGVEVIGDGSPVSSTTQSVTLSLRSMLEESTLKLKGLWLQSRKDFFIVIISPIYHNHNHHHNHNKINMIILTS